MNPPATEAALSLADLAEFRAQTYRVVAQALLEPDRARLRFVRDAARELIEAGAALARFAIYGEWLALLRNATGLATRPLAAVERSYAALFLVSSPCPPFEAAYVETQVERTGWVHVQLSRAYAEGGFELADASRSLDHIAVELEFAASLCAWEAEAWDGASEDDQLVAHSVQRRQRAFLAEHPSAWLPQFAGLVELYDEDNTYAPLCRAASAFVTHDRDLLDALLGHDASVDGIAPA